MYLSLSANIRALVSHVMVTTLWHLSIVEIHIATVRVRWLCTKYTQGLKS